MITEPPNIGESMIKTAEDFAMKSAMNKANLLVRPLVQIAEQRIEINDVDSAMREQLIESGSDSTKRIGKVEIPLKGKGKLTVGISRWGQEAEAYKRGEHRYKENLVVGLVTPDPKGNVKDYGTFMIHQDFHGLNFESQEKELVKALARLDLTKDIDMQALAQPTDLQKWTLSKLGVNIEPQK